MPDNTDVGIGGLQQLVGRDEPLGRVGVALDRAAAGLRKVVLVVGESGIGKTELVRAATRDRPLVGRGTCVDDTAAPGFWPWSQAIEDLARLVGIDQARRFAGDDGPLLATIAPVFGAPRPGEASARDRLLLLEAVGRWLEALTAVAPVIVALDDMHWADDSTLGLVDFVARSPRPAAVCLVGCYRPDELGGAARTYFPRLVSQAEHVPLGGLDRTAVEALVTAVAGPTPPATVDDIYRRGGGHPVFTRELALVFAHGETTTVPAAVRDAIERRVRRLPETTQQALQVAALAGNDLQPAVIAAAIDRPPSDVEAAWAPAINAGILVTSGESHRRFAHDLYRETLSASVDPGLRPALHHAIGAALENRLAGGGDVNLAELARHFAAALPLVDPGRAARWALAAASAERESLAFMEAAGHLRRWRNAVADAGVTADDGLRIDVLLAEADALARAGSAADARRLLRLARDIALACGSSERLALVALAVAQLGAKAFVRRDDVIRELETALTAIAGENAVLEARLTATLARQLQHSVADQRPRARPLSERALELGREAGDDETLLACLLARHDVLWNDVLWTPGEGAARVAIAREIVAVAEHLRNDELRAESLLLLANALLQQGSAAYLPTLESCLEQLDHLGHPRHCYLAETRRAALALMQGDLDEGAARIEAARLLGERIREPDTGNVWMSQRLELIRARCVPDELAAFASDAVAHWTGAPVHAHAVAAGFLARAGDLDKARHHVATVADLGSWRADRSYMASVFVRELSVAAIALGDHPLCVQLHDDLFPFVDICGVNGTVVAFAGSPAQTVGLLANAIGRDGMSLLRQARDTYQRLGATGWLADVERQLNTVRPETPTRSMRRHGRTWEIAFDGQRAMVPDSKGLEDLAVLLAKPGQDVHVLDLYGSPERSGPGGELADRRALDAYRQRLTDLDDDAAESAANHDIERQALVEQEREALLDELRRVARPGTVGARLFPTYPAERARKAVAARIRDTIRKLELDLPELAAHLDQTIVTGTYCRYRAEHVPCWNIETVR